MAEDLKKFIKEQNKETRRHFDVVTEHLGSEIQTVAEQVVQNSEDISEIKQDIKGVKNTLDVMKIDLEFIKNELKQKVNRDEFVALEKRLSVLEIRFNQK